MFDWQNIVVALIVLGALVYVGRRVWRRLGSFRASGENNQASCATGCGNCGTKQPVVTTPAKVFVQIGRPRRTPRPHAR